MTRYIILLPEGEERWAGATPEKKAEGYQTHARFTALLEERGHKVTGGAELTHSRHTTTLRKRDGGFDVTEGPYAEATEHVTGFYSVESDDLDDLVEVCKTLAGYEGALEIRPAVDPADR